MESDFWLIQKMRQGDDRAVEQFVGKYYPKVLLYCRLHLTPAADAEDVAQEVFEKFFRAFPKYRHNGKVSSYLYAIAANACRDHARKQRWEYLPKEIDAVAVAAADVEKAAERLDIKAALRSLPEELRQVAALFFCLEVKQREIAEILGIGLPLVKYRVKRARELLAAALTREE